MSGKASQSWGVGALVAAVGLLTAVAVAGTAGHLGVSAAPVLAVTLVYAILHLPARTSTLLLLLLALTLDGNQENMADGYWCSPLCPAGRLLFNNWSGAYNLPGLSFSGMDLLVLLILGTLLYRRWSRSGREPAIPIASCLSTALAVHILALVAVEAWGLARGGDGWTSYWQLRQQMYLPVLVYLLSQVIDLRRDLVLLGKLLVGATLVKIGFGFYFYYAICKPQGLEPEYITTHSDTVPFLVTLAVVGARWLEDPRRRHFHWLLAVTPVVLWAIFLNDRRLAYVGLLGSGLLVYAVARRSPARRVVGRLALAALPALMLYAVAGWGSRASFFKPVEAIRTMDSASDDASTHAREIENYNLAQTLRARPVLGTGFGHEFDEVFLGADISSNFKLYRSIPHNSLLWLLSAGGLVGLVGLWVLPVVGVYLAARSYRHAGAPRERAAALVCLCAILAYLVLMWGDMGFQSWPATLLLATALAVSGRLSVAVGAWP